MRRIEENGGGRMLFVDRARGLAMLLVVMGHVLIFSIYDEKNYDGWQLFDIIAFFHMPLFFFISGMVMKYDDMDLGGLWRKFYSRSVRLMVPFFVVGLIFCFTLGSHSVNGFLSSDMKDGYWYLWVLLVFSLFNYLLILWRKLCANKWGDLIWGILMTSLLKLCYSYCNSSTISWLSLYQIQAYYPYFFFASWLNHYGLASKLCDNIYTQFFILLATPLGLFAHISGVPHLGCVVRILCVISVVMVMYMLDAKKSFVLDKLEEYGRNSLVIYCLHFFLCTMLSMAYVGDWLNLHYSLGMEFIIAVCVSVFVTDVISKVGNLLKLNSIFKKIIA